MSRAVNDKKINEIVKYLNNLFGNIVRTTIQQCQRNHQMYYVDVNCTLYVYITNVCTFC